jgi:phage shock protein PspC (stress-responsive transcriptional regulator)
MRIEPDQCILRPMMETGTSRFARRSHDRLVAGVAGGLADLTRTSAIWWRLGFLIMSLFGGLGVLIYLLLWWLVPRADLPRSAGQRFAAHFPDAPAWVGVGLLMLGAVLLAAQLGLWTPNVGWAFLLIAFGVVLYRRDAERYGNERASREAAPFTTSLWAPESGAESPALPSPMAPTAVIRTPRPPRERSLLGWLTLGLALAAGGLVWLVQEAGTADPSAKALFALPLTIVGAGLLIGAFVGRAKWTILLGLVLVPFVLLASVITVPLNGVWQARSITPVTAADLRTTYQQSGDGLHFDFSRLQPGEHVAPIHASVGVGKIDVLLPKGMPVVIRASVGVGALSVLGRDQGGLGVTTTRTVSGRDPIVMNLQAGVGEVRVSWLAVLRDRTRKNR